MVKTVRTAKEATPATSLMSMAMIAIAAGITMMQEATTQFLGVCLVAVGIALVALHYLTGL